MYSFFAMALWSEFEEAAGKLAERGRELLYQFGPGLGFLATVRADGGPRVHPFCPILTEGGLYGLIGPSPKQRDLYRDSRYAIHSFPAADTDDEFYLTGRATRHDAAALVDRVRAAFLATGATSSGDEALFEFDIEHVMLATYNKRGTPNNFPPRYDHWHAPL